MTKERLQLPQGWALPRVDQVGSVRLGRQRSPDKHTGRHTTKYLRAANITPEGLDLSNLLEMDFTKAERAVYTLQIGDVVLTEASGSASQVGRAALWRGEVNDCCYQNTVIRFKPFAAVPEYALAVFRHFAVSGAFARISRGVGIQHLGASRLAGMPFPLPPLTEQRRIAELVDHRLGEIREANMRLRSALGHLAEQTREILAAAVAGELLERPHVSLATDSHTGASHRPPAAQEGDGQHSLPIANAAIPLVPTKATKLPPGWVWARMSEIAEVTIGRQRSPKHQNGPHMRPYLRVANVFEDRIDATDVLEMNFEPEEFTTYALRYGDILLNEGQSPELVGRPAKYRDEVPGACFQNHLIRFRSGPLVDPDFALVVFRHYMHAGIFRGIAKWSTNIASLGLNRFRSLAFPLPPIEEQTLIAAEVRDRLGTTAAQAEAVEASLARLPEMERELLAAAVAGELTHQDPNDEPAATLLEHLGPPQHDILPSQTEGTEKEQQAVTTKRGLPSRRHAPTCDLAAVLREAGRPLPLPELYNLAGYDRDQPEHVESFYLALRADLGSTIRATGDAVENALLEAVDAT